MSKRGLGKGLDALLATSALAKDNQNTRLETPIVNEGDLQDLAVNSLQPGMYQPRKEMHSEALEELAASIQSQGIIQPIVVRKFNEQYYEIIAGERRWRAAKKVGLTHVPCVIKDVKDKAAIAMALIENIQREDLNAIEEAQALERLQNEFELTHNQVAEVIGKSRTTVSNLLRLNQLEDEVKKLVEQKELEMGHARALLALESPVQSQVAEEIARKKLTVRQTEALVKKVLEGEKQPKSTPSTDHKISDSARAHLNLLEKQLDTKVGIQRSKNGLGKILINFKDDAQLEAVLSQLQTLDNV